MDTAIYLQTVSMILLAIFTFFQWRINKRIAWRIGAQETQSDLQLKLQAMDRKIPLIWWDPTKEKKPSSAEHRSEVKIERIYTNVPWHQRENRTMAARAGYMMGTMALHVVRPTLLRERLARPIADFCRNVSRSFSEVKGA